MSLDSEYNDICQSMAVSEKSTQQGFETERGFSFGFGDAKWGMRVRQYDGHPELTFKCGHCSMTTWTQDPNHVIQHCGVKATAPKELQEKLIRMQIKSGYRKNPSLVERVTGATPAVNTSAF